MMKSANFPQLQKRRIGKLRIIDIKGDLIGPWAVKMKGEIHSIIESEKGNAIVINLKSLQAIDSLGVKAIVEELPAHQESGFLNGKLSVMEMVHSVPLPKEVHIFQNEDELIRYFGKHLVSDDVETSEKRKYTRIHTALPLIFTCKGPKDETFRFQAVVTNLSEGGLFAEYLNLEDAAKSQALVNPYELKMLDLEIRLPEEGAILAKGKVVRRKLDGEQVGIGIEFYNIDEDNKRKVKLFLTQGG